MNVVPLRAAPIRPARPPVPAQIAIVLLAVAGARLALYGVVLAFRLEPIALVPLLLVGLWALVLIGLWRGGRGAYVVGIVVAALNILAALGTGAWAGVLSLTQVGLGLAVLLLLLASRRSRAFYAAR